MESSCSFVLLGGGGFSENQIDLRIEKYALKDLQKKKSKVNVCFIPTASGDSEDYIRRFKQAFSQLDVEMHVLPLLQCPPSDIDQFMADMDVLYVGGGNTKNLLAIWKAWDLDLAIEKHFLSNRDKVIMGVSAGAICWFDHCYTDSYPGEYRTIEGLGFLKGIFNPHHEGDRKAQFLESIAGYDKPAYGAGDEVGFIFKNNELFEVVSATTDASYFSSSNEKLTSKYLVCDTVDLRPSADERFVKAPYTRVGVDKGVLRLGFGSHYNLVSDKNERKLLLDALNFMLEPHTKKELLDFLYSKSSARDLVHQAYSRLMLKNYLVKSGSYDPNTRYSRHYLYYLLNGLNPDEAQSKLAKSHVAVLGCGGIGNLVATNLATLGVGKITLVDGDVVELSNLGRQIVYTEADIGKKKTEVLKREIAKRNPDCTVTIIDDYVCIESLKRVEDKLDIMVLSADSTGLVADVNQFSVDNKLPYINVGYVMDIAVAGPTVIPGETACHYCRPFYGVQDDIPQEELQLVRDINKVHQAPSIGPINMLSSSLGTLEVLKYIVGIDVEATRDKRVGFWTDNLRIQVQKTSRNTECPICGSK